MNNTHLPIHLVPRTTSTMDVMRARWNNRLPLAVVSCMEQTSGRGRFGNTWVATPGSSLMLTYPFFDDGSVALKLPFVASLAVRDFVLQLSGIQSSLLWPNDVVVGCRKLAGILTEQTNLHCFSIGIGVNLHQTVWPTELHNRAVSLLQLGVDPMEDILTLSHQLSHILTNRLTWAATTSMAEVVHFWRSFSRTPGVQYRLPSGEVVTAIDVNSDGCLRVSGNNGISSISSAEPLHKDWENMVDCTSSAIERI